jgi:hypothetical protein
MEASLIESFPDERKKYPNVCCMAAFEMDAIDDANSCIIFNKGGKFSNLAAIKDEAATLNGRQAKLIQMLNKQH